MRSRDELRYVRSASDTVASMSPACAVTNVCSHERYDAPSTMSSCNPLARLRRDLGSQVDEVLSEHVGEEVQAESAGELEGLDASRRREPEGQCVGARTAETL